MCGAPLTYGIAVVRYFGGTKLGAGGLFRAYMEAARTVSLGDNNEILLEELAVVTFVLNTYKDQYQLAEGKTNLDLLHYIKKHKLSSMDEIKAHLSEMEND